MEIAGYLVPPGVVNEAIGKTSSVEHEAQWDTAPSLMTLDCEQSKIAPVNGRPSDDLEVAFSEHRDRLKPHIHAYVSAQKQLLNILVERCFAEGVQVAVNKKEEKCSVLSLKTLSPSPNAGTHADMLPTELPPQKEISRQTTISSEESGPKVSKSEAWEKIITPVSVVTNSQNLRSRKNLGVDGVTQNIQKWISERKNVFAEYRARELSGTKLEQLRHLEMCTAVVVFFDAVWTGWQVQYRASVGEPHSVAAAGNVIISIAYVAELGQRLWIRKYGFFQRPNVYWNVFDMLIVACSVIEEAIGLFSKRRAHEMLTHLTLLRTLRMLRVWRVIRYLRTFESGRELRMLTNAALRACRSLVWASCLFVVILYIFAVALTSGASERCTADKSEHPLCDHFGLLGDSMFTLYKVMSGGVAWHQVADALEQISSMYMFIFVVFVSLAHFVWANMVLAVIVAVVHQTSRRDLEDIINDELEDKHMCYGFLHDLFKEMDLNMNGSLSRQEMELALQHNDRIAGSFAALKIDTTDLAGLFKLLVGDMQGAIGVDEFILGCLWLRGDARTVDVMKLHQRAESLSSRIQLLSTSIMGYDLEAEYINDGEKSFHQEASRDRHSSQRRQSQISIYSAQGHILTVRNGAHVRRIKRVEERAMMVSELLDLRDLIWKGCTLKSWKDNRNGDQLIPEDVNLYNFSYNMLCPSTLEAVNLNHDGRNSSIQKGAAIVQLSSDSHDAFPIAEGIVEDISDKGVKVSVEKGRFVVGLPLNVTQVGKPQRFGTVNEVKSIRPCSYKELISGVPLLPTWFISHYWGESILDFIKCCEKHSRLRHLKSGAGYWICAYANCQHELADEIGQDPSNSSFRKAMLAATGVLLILDSLASPFSRIWCDFELYCTITDNKPLDTITVHEGSAELFSDQTVLLPHESMLAKTEREADFPISLMTEALRVNLEEGSASNPQDREQILQVIANQADGDFLANLERANSRLRGVFARAVWPQAVTRGCVEAFGPNSLSLPSVLSQDHFRERLQMSLAHFPEVTDDEIRNLAAAIPSEIVHLILSFQGCTGVTNTGLHILAKALRLLDNLKTLSLDFLGCEHVSDAGLEALADCVPSKLQDLRLHFDACPQVGPRSANQLAKRLPPGLSSIHISFLGTRVNRVFKSKGELLGYSRGRG